MRDYTNLYASYYTSALVEVAHTSGISQEPNLEEAEATRSQLVEALKRINIQEVIDALDEEIKNWKWVNEGS